MMQLRPIRWLREHPARADVLLAVLVVGFSVVVHLTLHDPNHDYRDPSALGVVVVLGATVPLAWRRRAPGTVLGVTMAFQLVLEAGSWLGTGWVNLVIAAYTVGAHRSGKALWWIGGVAAALAPVVAALGPGSDGSVEWQAIISASVLFAASIVLGDNMRRRRERAAELVERAERAERERELVATQRVQQERTRIAREMHDVVAHSVSVMIIQAGAARRQVVNNPQQAIGVLETIETTGREAMSEMRRVLGVLRNDDLNGAAEHMPQPSLTSLGDLMTATSDLPVSLHTAGNIVGLPPGVELSAYRVVQEALTNVRRHAGRVDRVDVAVTHTDDTLVVEVTDNGIGSSSQPGSRALAAGQGSVGYGIAGMRERVSMFGGSLNAGPRQGGGWRVRATFPVPTR